MEWCTIESDPGVFTELITKIGVKGVQVEEIYSLEDQNYLQQIMPIYGLVFLFKWQKLQEQRNSLDEYDPDLYFAKQMIPDACATQALLSILFNSPDLDIGKELQEFKSFTLPLDSQTKGETIGQQELIRNSHNSFARNDSFIIDNQKKKQKEEGDAFHFISYIPFKGKVYELDGLQKGPIVIGCFDQNKNWLDIAKKEIQQRIEKYSQEEVRFNLLAICTDISQKAKKNIGNIQQKQKQIYKILEQNKYVLNEQQKEEYKKMKESIEIEENQIQIEQGKENEFYLDLINSLSNEQQFQLQIIEQEKQKKEQYKIENTRRKHNYIPFILELLKKTAQKGKLDDLVKRALEKREQKNNQQKK